MATSATTSKPKGQSHLLSDILVNGILILIVIAWLVPTVGLVVSSFRTRFDIQTSGWWSIVPHRAWQTAATIPVPEGVDRSGVMRSRRPGHLRAVPRRRAGRRHQAGLGRQPAHWHHPGPKTELDHKQRTSPWTTTSRW